MGSNPLARRIRAFRKLKGFTQTELAESVGVSIAIIGAVERGARKAEGSLIQRISEVLGVDQQELLPPVQPLEER
ncbi:MAG: Xre family transcriptional regulator [Bacilli bacterium]|jgi:transcriptional regulator with XRE-family HTH domain|nr:Xre family transcriptional regulator [Bacilli bacterium]